MQPPGIVVSAPRLRWRRAKKVAAIAAARTLRWAGVCAYPLRRGLHGPDGTDAGAPNANAMIGTKERLYIGERSPGSPTQTIAWLPIDGTGAWTWLTVPADFGGSVFLAYDPDHKVLYSANQGGLWRMVTE